MYSIYAISDKEGTQNVDSADTEELAQAKVKMLKSMLDNGVWNNTSDLDEVNDFGYDTL